MPLGLRLATWILVGIVRVLQATYRIRVRGAEHRYAAEQSNEHRSFALALWHEQLCASIVAHAGQKIAPLASLSRDGDIITCVLDQLGYQTIRGSSSLRGEKARDELVAMTESGWFTAITIDGPRGPRRRVKGGIVDVARRTGVPIVPLVSVCSWPYVFQHSWDGFQVPLPFSRIVVRYGRPIPVPADTSGMAFGRAKKALRQELELIECEAQEDLAHWAAQ